MLGLREKAMDALGDKFDNPPLFIVEEKIDEMIANGLADD